MAGTIIDMSKIKQLLHLKKAGVSNRQIANSAIQTNLTNMFEINPNIAYYIRITDKIFYCPEFGVSGGLGPASEAQTASVRYNYLAADFTAYLQPFNFEFRVSPHWGIGVGFGDISYHCIISADTRTGKRLSTNGFLFNLSDGVWARYYF